MDLWGIGTERASVPSGEAIRHALSGVGYQNLVLDEDKRQVMRNTDFRVDLGAIAKGYACDEVVGILQNAGIDAELSILEAISVFLEPSRLDSNGSRHSRSGSAAEAM